MIQDWGLLANVFHIYLFLLSSMLFESMLTSHVRHKTNWFCVALRRRLKKTGFGFFVILSVF